MKTLALINLFIKTIILAYSTIHCGCKFDSGSSKISKVLLFITPNFSKNCKIENDFIPVAQSRRLKIYLSALRLNEKL